MASVIKDGILPSNIMFGNNMDIQTVLTTGLILLWPTSVVAQEPVHVVIANYNTSWKFEVDISVPKAELVEKTDTTEPEERSDALAEILKELREKQSARRSSAHNIHGRSSEGVEWVELSPDCHSIVVGHEDPAVNVQRNISYGQSDPWTESGKVTFVGRHAIEDVAWSPDSRFLVVIESKERYSKSLRGILMSIMGHPIPLNSLYLVRVEVSSGRRERLDLLSDIPYGTAVIYGPQRACDGQ